MKTVLPAIGGVRPPVAHFGGKKLFIGGAALLAASLWGGNAALKGHALCQDVFALTCTAADPPPDARQVSLIQAVQRLAAKKLSNEETLGLAPLDDASLKNKLLAHKQVIRPGAPRSALVPDLDVMEAHLDQFDDLGPKRAALFRKEIRPDLEQALTQSNFRSMNSQSLLALLGVVLGVSGMGFGLVKPKKPAEAEPADQHANSAT